METRISRRWVWGGAALWGAAALLGAQSPVGRVSDLVPRARLTRARAVLEVRPQAPVFLQDTLETEKRARLRVELADGSLLNLGPRSKFTLEKMDVTTQTGALVLLHGRLRAEISKRMRPRAEFTLRTQTAVVGVIGTTAFVAAFPEETFVANLSADFTARLRVRSSDPTLPGEVILKPGYGTRVALGAAPEPPRLWEKERIERARDDSREFVP